MNKEKDYAAKERLSIRGPMTALFGSEGLVENGIVEQAVEFTKRNTGKEYSHDTKILKNPSYEG